MESVGVGNHRRHVWVFSSATHGPTTAAALGAVRFTQEAGKAVVLRTRPTKGEGWKEEAGTPRTEGSTQHGGNNEDDQGAFCRVLPFYLNVFTLPRKFVILAEALFNKINFLCNSFHVFILQNKYLKKYNNYITKLPLSPVELSQEIFLT